MEYNFLCSNTDLNNVFLIDKQEISLGSSIFMFSALHSGEYVVWDNSWR